MHSAVMQNAKYMKFADKNTVEVISLGGLQQGVDRGDRKAATYEGERDGEKIDLMVSWPNLTMQEVIDLNRSKAGQYNKTGKIPYTAIVDPHTEEEIQGFLGGQGSGTLMDAVKSARKQLVKDHGKGMSRRDLRAVSEAQVESRELSEKGEYSKALGALDAVGKDASEWPQEVTAQLDAARAAVVSAADAKLDEIEAMMESDPKAAKRELGKVSSRLRGTGLEDRAKELKGSL